jgi:4-alpha-glucanotransferase
VNFGATRRFREARLRQAFARFQRGHGERGPDFRAFCEAQADWLDDFALFLALRRDSGGKPWTDWAPELRARQASALRAARGRLANEVAAHRFAQFVFDRQWRALRQHAQERGIRLIGDLPIFVAQDSADVWCHQELFELDRDGRARKVSGYPPDRFSPKGQLWGHPQYRWAVHRRTGFAWWVQRFARLFELFDAVRVDHFLGFTRTWSIPAGVASPERGRWVESPGEELFSAVRRQLGERPLIAEDLGRVTPADVRLREAFGCAPMRIFQFGFGREQDATDHLPHNYPSLCAAYTGNHDNNTTVGWFRGLPRAQRDRVLAYTGGRAATIHLDSLRAVLQSSANLAICPLQDVFGLDRAARMNTPGTVRGNWRWRLAPRSLTSLAKSLRQRAALFGRLPPP